MEASLTTTYLLAGELVPEDRTTVGFSLLTLALNAGAAPGYGLGGQLAVHGSAARGAPLRRQLHDRRRHGLEEDHRVPGAQRRRTTYNRYGKVAPEDLGPAAAQLDDYFERTRPGSKPAAKLGQNWGQRDRVQAAPTCPQRDKSAPSP